MCTGVTLPPLAAIFISHFFQLANFNVINVGWFYAKMFFMPNIDPFNDNFAALGFGDTYFINNFGSLLFSFFYFIALQMFVLLLRRLRNASLYVKYKRRQLQPQAFWNTPIQVIIESYSMLSLSSLMTVHNPHWDFFGQKIDIIMAYIGVVITILSPVVILYLMIKNFNNFQNRNI